MMIRLIGNRLARRKEFRAVLGLSAEYRILTGNAEANIIIRSMSANAPAFAARTKTIIFAPSLMLAVFPSIADQAPAKGW